ncbi:hypothetical protein Tco_1113725 [Tanacetum coccineum]|uniref:Synaptobrevin, longin-like domain protein n=1 Tax=Tanacetum coccineum TaxID=301880 RepID=A0ABQ5IT03_9ASTR
MSALKFADSHNMVAFLAKPTESEGFEQIVDFLNANPIKYALTLQASVDGKKVIITETSVRRDLQLEDAEGIECLPNADIFEQLALMGYEKPSQKLTFYKAFFSPQWKFLIHTILQCLSAKSTAWNEFSSTMASAIICLATNQKFNFSKYIFESMVKNVDSSVKFLMYPRFVQVFLDKQVGDMSTHDENFVTPSHTKKVFGNMKRVGKGFSRAVTPLFPTMLVQAQEEMGEGSANPTDPHHTPIITQPSTSQPQKKQKPRKSKRKDIEIPQSNGPIEPIADETANEENRVLDLENTKTAQAHEISSLKLRVKRLEKKGGSITHKLKRLFKVGRSAQVVFSKDEGLGDQEDASKQGRKINDIDKDAEVTLVDETQRRYGDNLVFDTTILDGKEVFAGQDVVEKEISTADPVTTAGEVVTTASVEVSAASATPVSAATTTTTTAITEVDLTLAQALAELRSAKPKDKGKANMIEHEKPLKKKEQIRLDEELAFKLQAEEEERARLAREKAEKVEEAYISWDNVQAMIKANRLLAKSLQAREQEELTNEEKARLFVELLEKKKKHFAVTPPF